jgi:hypothetical protein
MNGEPRHDELGRRLMAAATSIHDPDWDEVVTRAGRMRSENEPIRKVRRLGYVIVASAAACVAAVLVVNGGGGAGVSSASGATFLKQVALRAGSHGLIGAIPPGEFWYQRYTARVGGQKRIDRVEKWLSSTGAGRLNMSGPVAVDATFPSASWAHAKTSSRINLPSTGLWQPYPITGEQLSYQQMLKLPTDPEKLQRLLAPSANADPQERNYVEFSNLTGLLSQPALPGRLRAGLYEALALVPGVQRLGSTRVDGTRGVVIGEFSHGSLSEITVEPRIGLLLEVRVLTHATIEGSSTSKPIHGRVIVDSLLTASGIVTSVKTRTDQICWPTTGSSGPTCL